MKAFLKNLYKKLLSFLKIEKKTNCSIQDIVITPISEIKVTEQNTYPIPSIPDAIIEIESVVKKEKEQDKIQCYGVECDIALRKDSVQVYWPSFENPKRIFSTPDLSYFVDINFKTINIKDRLVLSKEEESIKSGMLNKVLLIVHSPIFHETKNNSDVLNTNTIVKVVGNKNIVLTSNNIKLKILDKYIPKIEEFDISSIPKSEYSKYCVFNKTRGTLIVNFGSISENIEVLNKFRGTLIVKSGYESINFSSYLDYYLLSSFHVIKFWDSLIKEVKDGYKLGVELVSEIDDLKRYEVERLDMISKRIEQKRKSYVFIPNVTSSVSENKEDLKKVTISNQLLDQIKRETDNKNVENSFKVANISQKDRKILNEYCNTVFNKDNDLYSKNKTISLICPACGSHNINILKEKGKCENCNCEITFKTEVEGEKLPDTVDNKIVKEIIEYGKESNLVLDKNTPKKWYSSKTKHGQGRDEKGRFVKKNMVIAV